MTQLLWTQKQDIGPAARSRFDMVYDSARGRVVLYGGQVGTAPANDTWEWNAEEWTQTADIGPSARLAHAMAYDSKRQRVVLFGGNTGGNVLGDTWEWDGESWTQVADTGPSPRSGHAMTFDSLRQRVVLFGGYSGNPPALGDTWTWDGNEWAQEQDSGPSGRFDHRLVYDSVRDRVVLFGGTSATGTTTTVRDGGLSGVFGGTHTEFTVQYLYLGDTWEYDGALWAHVADTGPEPRSAYGMAYDGEEVLLLGGFENNLYFGVATSQYFGSTWSWSGKYWTQRQDMGPGARAWLGMAYDSARKRGVLFGGTNGKSNLADTWELFQRPALGAGPE